MKPGYRWRILAHRDRGASVDMTSAPLRRDTDRWWSAEMQGPRPGAATELVIKEPSLFDELVIDDWVHLEQMNTRTWWLNLGGYHLWVHIPAKGEVVVSHDEVPLSDYGLRKD